MKLFTILLSVLLLYGCSSKPANLRIRPVEIVPPAIMPPVPKAKLHRPVEMRSVESVQIILLQHQGAGQLVDIWSSTNLQNWTSERTTDTDYFVIPSEPKQFFKVTGVYRSVALVWDPSAGAVSYNVFTGVSSRNYTNINSTTSTTIVLSNLVASTVYYFAATALNAAGLESEYSNECVYRTPEGYPVPARVVFQP